MTPAAWKQNRYVLTETAAADFQAARRWSLARWGKSLTRQYFSDLHNSAEILARHPLTSTDLEQEVDGLNLRIHAVREHYLIYVPIHGERIAIVALIRQTRDVPAILNANAFQFRRQLKVLSQHAPPEP